MRKDRKYMLTGGAAVVLGWLSSGFSFTSKLGQPLNTILLLVGIILFITGIVIFIIGVNTKSYEK